jgi:hypothetical protein
MSDRRRRSARRRRPLGLDSDFKRIRAALPELELYEADPPAG